MSNPVAESAAKPVPSKRAALVAALTVLAGAISGIGSTCGARAAMPTELEAVRAELAGLRAEVAGARKDQADVLLRLRTVELVQVREEEAAKWRDKLLQRGGR